MTEQIKKILDFVHKNPVLYFASVDRDSPRVRPFGSIIELEDKIYMGMGDFKESYRQVRANPNIEFCTCAGDGTFLRVRGKAVFDDRQEVWEAFLKNEPELAQLYTREIGNRMATFYISEGYAEFQYGDGHFDKFCF
ncbi:MAG: pyridoxamine 5'-phosphate oxidase family protein [Oscillospiraceae bacterium]|jgi:uncharacterized pyridoxamine 5'-phosphate oxidase family protein